MRRRTTRMNFSRRHALCTWIAAYRCLTWSSSPKGFEKSDSSSSLITEPTDPRRLRLGGSGGGLWKVRFPHSAAPVAMPSRCETPLTRRSGGAAARASPSARRLEARPS